MSWHERSLAIPISALRRLRSSRARSRTHCHSPAATCRPRAWRGGWRSFYHLPRGACALAELERDPLDARLLRALARELRVGLANDLLVISRVQVFCTIH